MKIIVSEFGDIIGEHCPAMEIRQETLDSVKYRIVAMTECGGVAVAMDLEGNEKSKLAAELALFLSGNRSGNTFPTIFDVGKYLSEVREWGHDRR